ncbi:hypothetical protein BKA93DRAFT_547864 [Sparassis latifolia]
MGGSGVVNHRKRQANSWRCAFDRLGSRERSRAERAYLSFPACIIAPRAPPLPPLLRFSDPGKLHQIQLGNNRRVPPSLPLPWLPSKAVPLRAISSAINHRRISSAQSGNPKSNHPPACIAHDRLSLGPAYPRFRRIAALTLRIYRTLLDALRPSRP